MTENNSDVAPEPTPAPSEPLEVAPADPTHDTTDVKFALQRETHDGKGDDEVPPADFQSFATEGVENATQEDNQ